MMSRQIALLQLLVFACLVLVGPTPFVVARRSLPHPHKTATPASRLSAAFRHAGEVTKRIHDSLPQWLREPSSVTQISSAFSGGEKTSHVLARFMGYQATIPPANPQRQQSGHDTAEEHFAGILNHALSLGGVVSVDDEAPRAGRTNATTVSVATHRENSDHVAADLMRRYTARHRPFHAKEDKEDELAVPFEDSLLSSDDDYEADWNWRHHQQRLRLRQWRTSRRNRMAKRKRPSIPVAHLPYKPLKPKKREGDEHRGFHAAQTDLTRSDPDAQRPVFCQNGVVAVSLQYNFTCTFALSDVPSGLPSVDGVFRDSGSNNTVVPGFAYAAMNKTLRDQCRPQTARRQCICPRDNLLATTVLGDTVCLPKEVHCDALMVLPIRSCESVPNDQPAVVPKCYEAPTRGHTVTIGMNFSCVYAWANPVDYEFFGVKLRPEPNGTYVVLDTSPAPTVNIRAYPDSSIAVAGTYQIIQNFAFLYQPSSQNPITNVMPLTATHPFYADGKYFYKAYNFNELSDDRIQTTIAIRTSSSGGELTGGATVDFTLPLANVPDSFLNGNRLYVESGVRSQSIRHRSRVSDGISSDRLTIDFRDRADPPPKSTVDTTAIAIGVGVSVGVLVVGLLIAFGVWRRNRSRKEEKERAKDESQ